MSSLPKRPSSMGSLVSTQKEGITCGTEEKESLSPTRHRSNTCQGMHGRRPTHETSNEKKPTDSTGLYRAYLDEATKRIFWVDQATGSPSWYVSSLNPEMLPSRSYVRSQEHYNARAGIESEAKNNTITAELEPVSTTPPHQSNLSTMSTMSNMSISALNSHNDILSNERKRTRRSETNESMSSVTSSIPSVAHSEPEIRTTNTNGV